MFWLGTALLGVLVLALFLHGVLKIAAGEALMERERAYQDWLRLRDSQAVRAIRNGKVKV